MGNKSHILDFTSKQPSKSVKRGNKPLPVLVEQVRSIFLKDLDQNLKKMLEQADDCLFDMAEGGDSKGHFGAMRMLRLKKDGLIRNFQNELVKSFAENLGKSDEDVFGDDDQSSNLSFENIALVDESDLEEGIAIDGIVKKARNTNVEALEAIRTRLDALIAFQTISKENNPFEPTFICTAFKKASKALDIDIESLLIVYKLLERTVIAELGENYHRVNQFFVDKGVLPELKVSYKPKRATSSGDSASRRERDEARQDDASSKNDSRANEATNDQIISLMQGLLAQSRGSERLPKLSNSSEVQIETPQLISALTNLQGSNQLESSNTSNIVQDLRSALSGLLGTQDRPIQQGALGQFNEDMIDIVSMLFDFILDDKNVHAEIKAIIARLQIPMLKVGLVDRTFFSNKKHPARILLNEIARAGISWDPSDKEAQKMLAKIESICEEINTTFKDDISIFDILLNDFQTFKSQIEQRAAIFERRTREAEEGKARAESARGIVNQELEKICRGKHIPVSVRELLKKVWVNVMFLERLRENQKGWETVCQIAKLLVWSVQPVTKAETLEKLTSRIPILIKNIRKGFEVISLSPIDATRMLENMEATHRQIIKQAQEKIEADSKEEILRLPPVPFGSESSGSALIQDSEAEEFTEMPIEKFAINEIGFSAEETGEISDDGQTLQIELKAESLQAIECLNAGHWVELELLGNSTRCKLAAKISSTGKYIFVNRSGVKLAEFYTDALAAEYQLGRLKILDDEALFDRALESVISNLRAMKAEA